jgi:hypothetical protein
MDQIQRKSSMKSLIVMLGITYDEIIIELEVDEYKFDSIEWDRDVDDIFLHTFEKEISIEYTFSALRPEVQDRIHNHLLKMIVV